MTYVNLPIFKRLTLQDWDSNSAFSVPYPDTGLLYGSKANCCPDLGAKMFYVVQQNLKNKSL
jgi:hypothetical protein